MKNDETPLPASKPTGIFKKILTLPLFYLFASLILFFALLPLADNPMLLERYLSPAMFDAWLDFQALHLENWERSAALVLAVVSLICAIHAYKQAASRHKVALIILYSLSAVLWWLLSLPPEGVARERAKRISCQSNLRQIYQTIQQYATDYQGYCPPDLQTLNKENYLTDPDIYRCPSRIRPNLDFSDFDYFGHGRKLNDPVFLLLQDRDQNHPGKFYNNVMSDGEIKSGDKIAAP